MPKVFIDLAVSPDGFISGPDGQDGALHDWSFAEPGAAEDIKRELLAGMGAMILGHTAFGSAPDGFDTEARICALHPDPHTPAPGPARRRHLPLRHGRHPERPDPGQGRRRDRDIRVAGGADVARQYLNAGLVDEIQLHLAPVLLGGGLRLWDGLEQAPVQLERLRVLETAHATHLRCSVVRA